jgi:hypothetical protein
MAQIADRLSECIDVHLRMSTAEATAALGYRNRTMLSNVRSGRSLPDPLRLVKLTELRSPAGKHVDLHWLLTGEGVPLRDTQRSLRDVRSDAKRVVSELGHDGLEAVLALAPRKSVQG